MACIARTVFFASVLIARAAHCQGIGAEISDSPETLTFSHTNWGFPAYFTTAPESIVGEMKSYLASICDGYDSTYGLDVYVHDVGDADWLCERKEIYFYRGVDGWGQETRSGYACKVQLGLPTQHVFGDSRFADYKCIFFYYNEEAHGYEIEFMREEE